MSFIPQLAYENDVYRLAVKKLADELREEKEFKTRRPHGGRPRNRVGEFRQVEIKFGFETFQPSDLTRPRTRLNPPDVTLCRVCITQQMLEDAQRLALVPQRLAESLGMSTRPPISSGFRRFADDLS
jgi:hypothetical protein